MTNKYEDMLEEIEDIDTSEDLSLYTGNSDNTENPDPETTLEFDTLLITPSDSMKNIPTVNRELLSTKLNDKDISTIIHYDKIIQKYNIFQHIQVQKIRRFVQEVKEKIKRGVDFQVIKREFDLEGIGYDRMIKVMIASTKSREGFTMEKIKTNLSISREERKETSQELIPSENKKKNKVFN